MRRSSVVYAEMWRETLPKALENGGEKTQEERRDDSGRH